MAHGDDDVRQFWDKRYIAEGRIWGATPSTTAELAVTVFNSYGIRSVFVPGSGYGRNSKLFSDSGFAVSCIEISGEAVAIAKSYNPEAVIVEGSVLGMDLGKEKFDGIYCFNVLHLYLAKERELFIQKCEEILKPQGIMVFVVFSETENSFGKGPEVEENTFESKPGRPVHYFSESDLLQHFSNFRVIETGLAEDTEEHGEEGRHIHVVRYIICQKR